MKTTWEELVVSQDMNSCNLNPESKPLTVVDTWSPLWRLGQGNKGVVNKGREDTFMPEEEEKSPHFIYIHKAMSL